MERKKGMWFNIFKENASEQRYAVVDISAISNYFPKRSTGIQLYIKI